MNPQKRRLRITIYTSSGGSLLKFVRYPAYIITIVYMAPEH